MCSCVFSSAVEKEIGWSRVSMMTSPLCIAIKISIQFSPFPANPLKFEEVLRALIGLSSHLCSYAFFARKCWFQPGFRILCLKSRLLWFRTDTQPLFWGLCTCCVICIGMLHCESSFEILGTIALVLSPNYLAQLQCLVVLSEHLLENHGMRFMVDVHSELGYRAAWPCWMCTRGQTSLDSDIHGCRLKCRVLLVFQLSAAMIVDLNTQSLCVLLLLLQTSPKNTGMERLQSKGLVTTPRLPPLRLKLRLITQETRRYVKQYESWRCRSSNSWRFF